MMTGETEHIGLKRGMVRLMPHKREWADLYETEAQIIRVRVGELVADIQHVGSTAVPGLVAKPILDIAMAVTDKSAVPAIIGRLARWDSSTAATRGVLEVIC